MRSRVAIAIVAAIVVGCSAVAGGSRHVLTVYAAASLEDVLDAAKPAYEATHPGFTLAISTGSSSALETQIEQGAPADVLLSADTANPQRLVDAGLADGGTVDFARNDLVVVVPDGNPAGIRTPADLARPGVRIVAAGAGVPISSYAARALANLAALPDYPPDFESAYAANVISREDNVGALLAKIELGEGDAGIVYATDARGSSRVETIALPDAANVSATYAGVVVKTSPNMDGAHAFLSWLVTGDGQASLARFGFRPPP